MPFATLRIIPSVDIEKTAADNAAALVNTNFIRWREGIPEKRGGWTKYINAVFSGIVRALHAWQGLNKDARLSIGTTTNLYLVYNGTVSDITAQTTVVNIAVNLTTTIGSNIVTVTDVGRNASIYNTVVFNTPASVGGIVLYGAYNVTQAGGPNTYQIMAASNATATVLNGGAVPNFTTTVASAQVTVTLNNHGLFNGQLFAVLVPTTVGGITISGQYIVTQAATNTFVINAASAATSSTSGLENGGNLNLTYYVVLGPSILGTGYGIGTYGQGGYGSGLPSPTFPGTKITATDYWLDNWGEILLSCPAGGPIFTWAPDTGNANAGIIPQAPLANAGMFLAMPQQQIMAWGSTYNGLSDPLQIRWCDAGNYQIWQPQAINQAGGYRIPTGSQIIRGMQGSRGLLWFTDIDLYASQYVGPSGGVWGFNRVATGCGLIGPKAVTMLGPNVYWMSQKQFLVLAADASVQPIPCTVWDAVFQNLNTAYVRNIRAASNAQFNEVTWFYPSLASTNGENDSYVTFNVLENEWDIGLLSRTAWIDQSVLGPPIGSGSDSYIYQHETSPDAAGLPIVTGFTTGFFSITEGNDLVFVDWMLPDMKWGTFKGTQNATLQMYIAVTDYVGDTPRVYGPFTFSQSTEFIEPRFRGRFWQISIVGADVGSFWRLGSFRIRYQIDGRR